MKFAVLLTVMLSGLCAAVVAAPIRNLSDHNPTAPTASEPIVTDRDRAFNAGPVDEAFIEEYQPELVTTDIDFSDATDEEQLVIEESQATGSFGVPEPPPVTMILIGMSFLGIAALWGRNRRKRRRARRRRVVRMRAIMAER